MMDKIWEVFERAGETIARKQRILATSRERDGDVLSLIQKL